MELSPKGKLIEKIIKGTLSNEYKWHKAYPLPNEILSNFPIEIYGIIETYRSYWFKTEDNFIAILSIPYNKYSIVLYSYETKEFSEYRIPTQSYFRIRTVIQNQLGINEKLLDDFLNS